MKIRVKEEKIELTVPEPALLDQDQATSATVSVTAAGESQKEPPTKGHSLVKARPTLFDAVSRFLDVIIVSLCGGIFGGITILLFFLLLPISSPINPVDVIDLVIFTSLSAFTIYLLCSLLPLWLGIWMLGLQIASGTYVGQVLLDVVCNWFLFDPQLLGPYQGLISAALTIVFSVIPSFAITLYVAAMESSPWKRTLGSMVTDNLVVDSKGKRLSFKRALKRELLSTFRPTLYPLSIALGKDYKNRTAWLEQTTGTMKIKSPEKLENEISKSRERVRVRYRAFQELESFLGRDNQLVPKVMTKVDVPFKRAKNAVIALAAVTFCVLMPTLFAAPAALMRTLLLVGGFHSWLSPFMTSLTKVFCGMPQFFTFLMSFTALYFVLAACRPTHVELTRAGLRFIFGAMPLFMQDKICPWNQVTRIFLEQVPRKVSVADHRLVIELTNGKRMRLRLGSISSVVGKEEILKAVERWAPSTPRTAEVISALQPPSDFSYTELWMEALSAPPKREKLKPLIDGAVLREQQFTVSRMLGVGGQGTAYLAEDAMSEQSVVLKEFLLPVYVDVGIRRKALGVFEKEARLLKELSHPNVVKLIDYFVEDHRAYLVLEHIDGESLRALVNRSGILTEAQVIELTKQTTEILRYLHSQIPPVVHRDFTPDNLILRKDGTLKLIDFNVAQQTDSTSVSSVVGKTAYLPPEQFRGTPTTQSDIYALGGCMQFLLTGHDPIAILSSDPRQINPDVSDRLAEIVQKATEPELADRFASAEEVASALE